MRRTVLAVGVTAVVMLGGVPTAAVLAAGGGHGHHAASSAGVRDDRSEAKESEAKESKESRETGHGRADAAGADRMKAITSAHRDGMRTWTACVHRATKVGNANPTRGCVKPLPPGWVKHPDRHADGARPGPSAGHARD